MGDGLRTTVQRLAVPLIVSGLVVGILVGLLLGWWVWPVQWYDMDPSDLRLEHQADYVILTGDSLAVTGDIEAASRRLAELTDGDTTWHQVANLVEKTAAEREAQGDQATALRLRRMAQATGLPLATASEFDPRAGADGPSVLLWVLAAVVLVGIGVAGYVYRMRSASAPTGARVSTPARWLDRAVPSATRTMPTMRPSTLDLQGEEDDTLLDDDLLPDDAYDDAYDLYEETDDKFADDDDAEDAWEDEIVSEVVAVPADDTEEDASVIRATAVAPLRPGNGDAYLGVDDDAEDDDALDDWEDEEDALDADSVEEAPVIVEEQSVAVAVPQRVERGAYAEAEAIDLPPDALGLFEAEYILGDDDFDASFTIESPDGEFLGECGVGMTDVLHVEDGIQRADAFEVWLFDKGDIRTETKVLVSEQAFRDEARSARLATKGELVIAQPGLEVMLETQSLRVTVTLRDCEFAEGSDGPEGHFVRLDLELLAEPSDALP